jgi:hypothetical protein
MITAYFDDSGTHVTSDIVLLAGLMGTEARLNSLERRWKLQLADPPSRHDPLSRFHMFDCQDHRGEFSGWTRTESDYFCHQLQDRIIEADIYAYGAACARKDWDALVTGDLRHILGDPEGFSIRNCFVKALQWAQNNTFDPEMNFVFDDRPQSARDARVVFHAYQHQTQSPKLCNIFFRNSRKAVLLQVADMIAWELYQHANDILVGGFRKPRRKQFERLTSNIKFNGQIATYGSIKKVVEHNRSAYPPEVLKAMAAHFAHFDPDNPDFSHLTGKSEA